MSNDFEKKIENLFLGENKSLDIKHLNNVIKNIFNDRNNTKNLNEEKTGYSPTMQQIMRMLPKFEFKEGRMGALTSETKEQFRSFFDQKLKSAITLKDKLAVIQEFCGNVGKETKINADEILSRLMILKIIENIVMQSTPGSAGYQFEALISAMFGTGRQLGGRAERRAEDIIIGNNRYQVKLIKYGGSVSIAYSNMERYFFDDPQKQNRDKTLGFIIAEKSNDQLIFYQTFLSIKDYIEIRNKYINKGSKKQQTVTQNKTTDINSPITEEQADVLGPVENIEGNFYLPRNLFVNNFAGSISVSQKVFEHYNKLLDSNVKEVLMNVADLVDNVNKFYINNDPNAAHAGRTNANNVATKLGEKN